MRFTRRSLVCFPALLVVLAGCGGPSAPSDGGTDTGRPDAGTPSDAALGADAPPDPALETAIVELEGALCTTTCNADFWFPSYDCAGRLEDRLRALDPSRYRLDPSRLDACAAALEADPCATYAVLEAGCEGAIVGLAVAGEPCDDELECAAGTGCIRPASGCATCVADAPAGGDCEAAHCSGDELCSVVSSSTGTTTYTCRPLAALGDDCFGRTCESGLFCEGTSSGFTCAPIGTAADGETCGETIGRRCEPGLVCSADGGRTCGAPLDLGDPCVTAPGGDFCPSGSHCGDLDGPGTCVADAALGEPCGTGDSCGPDARCVSGTCARWAGIGEACASATECRSGRCETDLCAPAECTG